VAFGLLSAGVILGLLMSTRLARTTFAGRTAYDAHAFLSGLTLTFIAVHGGALLFDGFFTFTPVSLVVPFISPYAPFWVGLGVIGAWTTAVVSASSLVQKQIGYRAWRRLHYLAFAGYVLSLMHGAAAGTDTATLPVKALYLGSLLIVGVLLCTRVWTAGRRSGRPSGSRRPGHATTLPRFSSGATDRRWA